MLDKYSINTAQNVSLNIQIAGFGDRVMALVIDYVILGGIAVFLIIISNSLYQYNQNYVYIMFALFSGLIFFYHFLMEAFMNGQTFGKKAMRIRVMQADGKVPGFFNYLARNVIRPLEMFGMIGILPVFFSEKYQRFGDMAANTVVVKAEQEVSLESAVGDENLPYNYEPVFDHLSISRLERRDVELMKEIVMRDKESVNWKLVGSMANKMKEKTGLNPEMVNIDFMKTLIHDYSYYNSEE
jgi:uncharacterized RDD family membrane protein YckC